jgi:hypothetical protein
MGFAILERGIHGIHATKPDKNGKYRRKRGPISSQGRRLPPPGKLVSSRVASSTRHVSGALWFAGESLLPRFSRLASCASHLSGTFLPATPSL